MEKIRKYRPRKFGTWETPRHKAKLELYLSSYILSVHRKGMTHPPRGVCVVADTLEEVVSHHEVVSLIGDPQELEALSRSILEQIELWDEDEDYSFRHGVFHLRDRSAELDP